MTLNYYLLWLINLFYIGTQAASFLPDEVVHVGDFSVDQIQNLKVHDETISFDGTRVVPDKVTKHDTRTYDSAIKISFQDATLTVTPDQLLFLPQNNNWVAAKNLKPNDLVLSISGKLVPVLATEELKKVMQFHDLTIQDQHNLFVTKLGILVHNEPVTAAFGMIAVSKVATATLGTVVLGALGYLGYKDMSANSRQSNSLFPIISLDNTSSSKGYLKRDEQAAKQAAFKQAEDRKAQQEKDRAHERACVIRSHERIAREKAAKDAKTKGQSVKVAAPSEAPVATPVPAAGLVQENEAVAGASEVLGTTKTEEAKKADEDPLGVKSKGGEAGKTADEVEAKKADEVVKKEEAVSKKPEKKLTDEEIKKALEELTDKANPVEKKSAQLSENPDGNISEDFDAIPFDAGVKEKETSEGSIRVGEFSNGYKVIERNYSSDGRSTIEIQKPNGRTTDKIRYGSK